MTLKECYKKFDGDYEEALSRLMNDDFMKRLDLKFIEDDNMNKLLQAFEAGDVEEAFRACHTLKGLSLNLGFSRLARSSMELTELLRNRDKGQSMDDCTEVLKRIKDDYGCVVEAISQLG